MEKRLVFSDRQTSDINHERAEMKNRNGNVEFKKAKETRQNASKLLSRRCIRRSVGMRIGKRIRERWFLHWYFITALELHFHSPFNEYALTRRVAPENLREIAIPQGSDSISRKLKGSRVREIPEHPMHISGIDFCVSCHKPLSS